jgi:hypothetical protein
METMLAVLEAMRGQPDEARALYRQSQRMLADLGLKIRLAGARVYSGMAELFLHEPVAAEREFRVGYVALEQIGEQAQLSTIAAFLARAVMAQGRYSEAEQLTVISENAASEDDLASQVLWRGTRARTRAHRGDPAGAERLARDAVTLARSSDFVNTQADVLMDLAWVLRVATPDAADDVAAEAVGLYEAKGNTASAEHARAVRARWQAASPA